MFYYSYKHLHMRPKSPQVSPPEHKRRKRKKLVTDSIRMYLVHVPTAAATETQETDPSNLLNSMQPQNHSGLASVMLSDGGGFASGSGSANFLPHRFTDESILTIPIPLADIEGDIVGGGGGDEAAADGGGGAGKKKGNWFSRRMSGSQKGGGKGGKRECRSVKMTRGEYLKYWAKGEDGKYLDSVVEPEEGRREWVRKKLEGQ